MKIVQLGAGWGMDHVTDLVRSVEHVEFLLLVEPNPMLQDKLKECYRFLPNVKIEQVAIVGDSSDEKELDMYFTELDSVGGYQVTSLIKNHVQKHNYPVEAIQTFRTSCITITELFNKHSIQDLDYLFIDIEGVDDEVLYSLDLTRFNVKNIFIESLHLPDPDKVFSFLSKNGYIDSGRVHNLFDRMFIKQN